MSSDVTDIVDAVYLSKDIIEEQNYRIIELLGTLIKGQAAIVSAIKSESEEVEGDEWVADLKAALFEPLNE